MRALGTAVRFLTRIPVGPVDDDPRAMPAATGWFPLVGLGVAGLSSAGFWGARPFVGGLAAAVIAVGLGLAVTGAFHEDGLADTVDGLWGGATPERRMEIMRDSRVGTYGASALFLSLLLQVALLAPLGPLDATRALVVGHTVGRFTVLPMVRQFPNARDEGHGARVALPAGGAAWVIAGATVLVAGVLAVRAWLFVAVLPALVAAWLVALAARRRIGGITGDVLGAANQAAHLVSMAVVAGVVRR